MTPSADQAFVLWDSESRAPESGSVFLWNGYADSAGRHSVFGYCEEHAERLRARYGGWIHDLGEYSIDGVRVVEHLAIDGGFSYWWMTRFVEQSPWKSPAINDAIRVLALEEILAELKPAKFRLVSANPILHEVLHNLCLTMGIDYQWERIAVESRGRFGLRDAYHALPQPVQALASFARDLWTLWPLRRASGPNWFNGEQSFFICSYFMYLDSEQADAGHFYSRYWGGLPGLMGKLGLMENWLQLYRTHDAVPTPNDALDLTERFNLKRREEGSHAFLDTYLSWSIVLRVLKRWSKLTIASWQLRGIEIAFRPQGSSVSLWPLMRGEWYASMRGPDAFSNLLSIELFDRALRDIPHQKKGLYLCENQAWERALIHAWRKHGHAMLIAVPHSTQSFWDLRYFRDPRAFDSSATCRLPQPDRTAVNGQAALETFIRGNHPREAIVECEALRYIYLNNLCPRPTSRKASGDPIKVLILGEYLSSGTVKMLNLLEAAVAGMAAPAMFTVKPHPNCLVKSGDFPALHLKVVQEPLGKILHQFDVAYSSNMTSAAVDAYLAGLPVVVALDETKLNYSPLRGRPGVRFVSTSKELAAALALADQWTAREFNHDEFFFLDSELPRWQKILSTS